MKVMSLDHLVLTVRDEERCLSFYEKVLGMRRIRFGAGRAALRFGSQKINVHVAGREFVPHANSPLPGSADLCFIVDTSIQDVELHLRSLNIPIQEGPVDRTGARGPIRSIYIRDPDANLIELSTYGT